MLGFDTYDIFSLFIYLFITVWFLIPLVVQSHMLVYIHTYINMYIRICFVDIFTVLA